MGISHPLGSTARGINISHPTLMTAERLCSVCPEDKPPVMGDKSGRKRPYPSLSIPIHREIGIGVGKSYSSPTPMDFSLALQSPMLP